jgi:hypothetical protein
MNDVNDLPSAEIELQDLESRLKTLLADYDEESREADDHGSPLAIAKARRDELLDRVKVLRAEGGTQSS